MEKPAELVSNLPKGGKVSGGTCKQKEGGGDSHKGEGRKIVIQKASRTFQPTKRVTYSLPKKYLPQEKRREKNYEGER